MKEKIWTIIGGIGTLLLWIGITGADSDLWIASVGMILAGLGMCYASAKILEK